jgi:hypothetical protein
LKQVAIESFQWAEELYPILKQFENEEGVSFYKVIAATSDIRNNNGRIYTRKEHEVAAASLSERPLNINHEKTRTLEFPQNQVVAARYEDGHVECIIQVADPETNRMIESGEINHVSVEGVYLDEKKNTSDTEYPTSLHYRALALLTQNDEPGDPQTRIFKENKGEDHHRFFFFTEKAGSRFVERIIFDSKMKTEKLTTSVKEAEWAASFVNDLPDSSFAAIEPGGKKDEEGKTTPRSLRHLPYRDANGKPDASHVRNALARLSQTQIPPALKAAARKKLVAAAKEVGIDTSMDEAFNNFRIAKEILQASLEAMDADSDPLVLPKNSQGASLQQSYMQNVGPEVEGENPAGVPTGVPGAAVPSGNSPGGSTEPPTPTTLVDPSYSMNGAVQLNIQQVPGATTSKDEAINGGLKKDMPEMDPHKNNPWMEFSPLGTTNQHHSDLQAQDHGAVMMDE